MTAMTDVAQKFFDACETGKGWQECRQYCTPGATFTAQAAALADVKTLEAYTNWMQGLFALMPDGAYTVKSFAADPARKNVAAFGVFSGTHTGQGGPVPPTGKRVDADYVYVMEFEGDKITHMTKIWNDVHAFKALGWVA
jgi:predicted ester cyclase